jgi:transcriptional regulator with XRE-family HTH domain
MQQETDIAERLRAARMRRGLSREELAVRSGLSWSAIAQIEGGRRTNVRPGTVAALASALGVSTDYLLCAGELARVLLEHHALLYADDDAFAKSADVYLRTGVELGESMLVVTSRHNCDVLRERLGQDAAHVTFEDSTRWLSSPPAALVGYTRFVINALQAGAPWVRVLSEPVWADKTEAEVRSWARFESLVNLMFVQLPMTIMCPYDTARLDPEIVSFAHATHPHASRDGVPERGERYEDPGAFLSSP